MLIDRTVFLNGKFIEWEKATVHIMSHSLARGSAIFEVMSFHDTEKGAAVFRLDEHITRLCRTAEILSMKLPFSKEAIQDAVLETVKTNHLKTGMVKLVCYYHDIAFDILAAQKTLDICIVVLDPALDLGERSLSPTKGVSASICRWRKLHPETVPIEAKVAANYLNGMMAQQEAKQRGFDVGIMVDTEGFIAEGSIQSVFFVKDWVLATPPLGTILQGVTRKSILEAAERAHIQTAEKRVKPETLMKADELLICSTTEKIVPIKKIEDRVIRGAPGPITKKLQSLFLEICVGKKPRFKKWLFPVR
ncbi:MAG: branched-chain-amino-acid transaminase [Proteobacteria bacterium]|nr:branched-chain-amino-acid transaminase [Pseudomonadota bacterium]